MELTSMYDFSHAYRGTFNFISGKLHGAYTGITFFSKMLIFLGGQSSPVRQGS